MFLNKPKFIEVLFQLFEEAENELVLIVPYVKMSQDVFKALKDCDNRGVEILMVSRKSSLKETELDKLKQLKHLTLLSHPNLHSKIYLNEYNIVIGSMNLYDYSQKFNREAGVILNNNIDLNYGNGFLGGEGYSEQCKQEIKEIISGSEEILVSDRIAKEGVNYKCIALEEENLAERARVLSQYLTTKTFKVLESNDGLLPTCISFYDNIDVAISNRVAIIPKYNKRVLGKVFKRFTENELNKFKPIRVYKSEYNQMFTVYAIEGEYLEERIFEDREYAKIIESTVMDVCRKIDSFYKEIIS